MSSRLGPVIDGLDSWLLGHPKIRSGLLTRFERWPPTARLVRLARASRVKQGGHDRANILGWSRCPKCPRALHDAGGTKIGGRLFVFCGYQDIASVNNKIFVFDLGRGRWVDTVEAPSGFPHSHMAICSDGVRFFYVVSGQRGAQCSTAIADGFAFDSLKRIWRELPALPAPRYAGTMQLLGERLHFVGGALPDRYTPASDHWSLAVKGGQAIDTCWREEAPIPRPAMHRGSVAIEDSLYVFGGQAGDFIAIKGDPNYTCTGNTQETYFPDTYRYDSGDKKWTRLCDMLVPASHTDFSVVAFDGLVHVIGGQVYKHTKNFRLRLTDLIQTYDVIADRWSIGGFLPYRLKVPVCAIHRERLYCTTGQKDRGRANDAPGRIIADSWCAPLSSLGLSPQVADRDLLRSLNGKDVALISHKLIYTGAPLLLVEAARAMQDAGANVRLFTLADDAAYGHPAERYRIPVLPIETAAKWAASADLVVANTVVTGPWIRAYLAANPSRTGQLIWWNHESSVEEFGEFLRGTQLAATMLFDSHASRANWEASGHPLPPTRRVVHPGNRNELMRAAEVKRLSWPGSNERLDRKAARRRLGVRENEFLLLCIGTMCAAKGQMLLLRTVGQLLARHPDLPVRLLLVGIADGSQRRGILSGLSPMERKAVLNGRLHFLSMRRCVCDEFPRERRTFWASHD